MLVIGLTGNIGMGKSTVAGLLKGFGAAHIDADGIGHELFVNSCSVRDAVLSAFGSAIATDDGQIDRGKLGALVFASPSAREKLNEITHPAIKEEVQRHIREYRKNKVRVVVLEAALFFEAGWDSMADTVWVVSASPETVVRRAQVYRGMEEKDTLSRLQAQLSIEEKKRKADTVIDTDCSFEEVARRVEAAWNQYIAPLLS